MTSNDTAQTGPLPAAAVIPVLGAVQPTRRAVVAGACGAAALVAGADLGLFAGTATARDARPANRVVIFHTNDVHGHLQGDGESAVGIDLVAGLRAATPDCLLLDAGDAMQGMPVVSLSQGASAIELMNAAGYDAMCLGNHEFDFGQDVLLANAEAAEFPLLGANVVREDDGEPLLAGVGACGDGATAVLTCAGRRIGVFGITTSSTAHSTAPANVEGLRFDDEVVASRRCIAALVEQGVDAIVALCHLGDGPVPCRGVDLAEQLDADSASHLAAIIDGHSHTVENTEVNGVLVVQTGCNLANLGKLTLAFDADGTVSAQEELLDPATVAQEAQPDAEVAAVLADVSQEQDALMAEVLFDTPTTLWGGWLSDSSVSAPTRAVETNLGDVVCDAFRAAATSYLEGEGLDATPVVAVENGGGIREALARGTVSKGDLVATFPFSNTVVLKQVTPVMLRQLFEGSFSGMAGQDAQTGMLLQREVSGGFLQMAGCTVTCDPNAEEGARVTSIRLEWAVEELNLDDDETPIVLVSNSYVMAGGDKYATLADTDVMADLGGELEVLQAYFDDIAGHAGEPALLAADVPTGKGSAQVEADEGDGKDDEAAPVQEAAGGKGDGTEAAVGAPSSSQLASPAADADGADPQAAAPASENNSAGLPSIPLYAGTSERLQLRGGYEPANWTAVVRLVDALGQALPNQAAVLEIDAGERTEVLSDENGLVYLTVADGQHAVCLVSDDGEAVLPECYLNNYLGYGLVEDDLRTYPQIVVA